MMREVFLSPASPRSSSVLLTLRFPIGPARARVSEQDAWWPVSATSRALVEHRKEKGRERGNRPYLPRNFGTRSFDSPGAFLGRLIASRWPASMSTSSTGASARLTRACLKSPGSPLRSLPFEFRHALLGVRRDVRLARRYASARLTLATHRASKRGLVLGPFGTPSLTSLRTSGPSSRCTPRSLPSRPGT